MGGRLAEGFHDPFGTPQDISRVDTYSRTQSRSTAHVIPLRVCHRSGQTEMIWQGGRTKVALVNSTCIDSSTLERTQPIEHETSSRR